MSLFGDLDLFKILGGDNGEYPDNYVDDDGTAVCCVCNRRYTLNNLESCYVCDKWVCKSCASYKDPDGMGEVAYCPRCRR